MANNGTFIPYLNMGVKITIGSIYFLNVSRIRIQESIYEIGDRAIIELPRNFGKLKDKPISDYISVGDKVEIQIGYNGDLQTEFTGYVSKKGDALPLIIECEDETWQLKQSSFVLSAKKRTAKELLREIAPGYMLDVPDLDIVKGFDRASAFEIMRWIQQEYGLICRIRDKRLTLGFTWDWKPGQTRHKLHRQKNVIKDRLAWKDKSEFKIRIRAYYMDGKHKKAVYVGDPEKGAKCSDVHTISASEADARNSARALFEKNSFDGFTGSLLSWGIPRTHAGDSLEYTDPVQPEKNGAYLIPKVEIDYSDAGWRRDTSVGLKVTT
jgi:hypothetical protein